MRRYLVVSAEDYRAHAVIFATTPRQAAQIARDALGVRRSASVLTVAVSDTASADELAHIAQRVTVRRVQRDELAETLYCATRGTMTDERMRRAHRVARNRDTRTLA